MIFDAHCAGCGRPGPVVCRRCRFDLAAPVDPPPPGEVIAALRFAGRARDVILGLKYGNRRQIAHHLAGLLVNRLLASGVEPCDLDVVTWAPTSRRRRGRRGFDQAELISRRVAAQLGLPCRSLLRRCGNEIPQTGRSRSARLVGPTFSADPRAGGLRVLVIDDVVTTGSTLRSAVSSLRRVGAAGVVRAAVAVTPSVPEGFGSPPVASMVA